jgi:signal transduction histidine kinase
MFRNNGVKHVKDAAEAKNVRFLNMIWSVTYLNLVICTVIFFITWPNSPTGFVGTTVAIHLLFWAVFFLVKYNASNLAKHVFMLTTYAMVIYYDHSFGSAALVFIYLYAFIPTAFNIFKYPKRKLTIFFYVMLVLVIVLVSNFYSYGKIKPYEWKPAVIEMVRIMNLILVFFLSVIYASYMVLGSNIKQTRLINQGASLQTTLNNATGAIWSIDKNYIIITANKAFAQFAEKEFGVRGIKSGYNLGAVLSNAQIPDGIRQHYIEVLKGNHIFEEFEFRNRVYEIKAVPILGQDDSILGATFTSRDITAAKASENALVEASRKAQAAIVAKARFLSNMSHEIRTPLNGIVGVTNIMLDEEYLPSQQKNLKTLANLSDHTLQLVNNILDLAKIEAGKAVVDNVKFNLLVFIKKIKSIFDVTAELKKLDFSIELKGNIDVNVKSDEVKLSQVLINLLGNAIKFTEQGFVKLKIEILSEETQINKQAIRFYVIDSGIGIKKEDQEKIFESFTQADSLTTRKFGGTGLGITISERILDLMGSKLHLDSDIGKGATFWFDVEMEKSTLEETIVTVAATSNMQLKDKSVLIAEDNPINQTVVKHILKKWGVKISIAKNGYEALEMATKDSYDIILMDLDMPVMDGYEATTRIKEIHPDMPFIALTAAAFDDMQNYLAAKGFNEVVQKPFMPDELFAKISALVK